MVVKKTHTLDHVVEDGVDYIDTWNSEDRYCEVKNGKTNLNEDG